MLVSLTSALFDRLRYLVAAALETADGTVVVWLLHPPIRLLTWSCAWARGSIRAILMQDYLGWASWILPPGWVPTIRPIGTSDSSNIAYDRAEARFRDSTYGRALSVASAAATRRDRRSNARSSSTSSSTRRGGSNREGDEGIAVAAEEAEQGALLRSFGHQVAGHVKDGLVIVAGLEGVVLKPRLKEHCFVNEMTFYESIYSDLPISRRRRRSSSSSSSSSSSRQQYWAPREDAFLSCISDTIDEAIYLSSSSSSPLYSRDGDNGGDNGGGNGIYSAAEDEDVLASGQVITSPKSSPRGAGIGSGNISGASGGSINSNSATELSSDKGVFMNDTSYGALYPLQFVPPYYGVTSCGSRPHIVLGDLTRSFVRPCVLDLKIGQQTYEPTASLEKIEHHRNKYPYQEEIGFRITGFKVYDKHVGTYASVAKGFGRSLTPENVKVGLAAFFLESYSNSSTSSSHSRSSNSHISNSNSISSNSSINSSQQQQFRVRVRKDIVAAVIERLEVLLRWIKGQNRYMFYCTSLLIIYEGDEHYHSRLRSVYQSSAVESMNYSLTSTNATTSTSTSSSTSTGTTSSPVVASPADGAPAAPHRLRRIAQLKGDSGSDPTSTSVRYGTSTINSSSSTSPGHITAEDFVEGIHQPATNPTPRVDVRMIDFAHTLPCVPNSAGVDAGYRFGIASLLGCLGQVLSIVEDDPSFVQKMSDVLNRCEKYISYNYARAK